MSRVLRDKFNKIRQKYTKDDTAKFLSRSSVRAIIWDKTEGQCWYCGDTMNPFSEFSIDHVVPVNDSGTDTYDNLVPCCRSCNTLKRARSLEDLRHLLARKEAGYPGFSDEQLEYLKVYGVDLDAIVPDGEYEFYFERQGLVHM